MKTVEITTFRGSVSCSLGSPLAEAAYEQQRDEILLPQVLLESISPGDIVVEIGAGIGAFSLLAGQIADQVIAIESDTNLCQEMINAARQNQITRLTVLNRVIGNLEAQTSGKPAFGLQSDAEVTVQPRQNFVIPLEMLLAEKGLPTPTILKASLTRDEIFSMAGLQTVLSGSAAPRLVALTLEPTRLIQAGYNLHQIFSQVEGNGYQLVLHKTRQNRLHLLYKKTGTTLLCQEETREPFALFVPSNDTHVEWMAPIASLVAGSRFMLLPQRDEDAVTAANKEGFLYYSYTPQLLGVIRPDILVLGNDWGPEERQVLIEARSLGIPTICIQEGPLLFNSMQRHLQSADIAFLQGDVMRQFVPHSRAFVTGNPKYDALKVEKLPEIPRVMINCNFTYGVFESFRDAWVADCVHACQQLGLEYFVSQHPRDHGTFPPEFNVVGSNAYKVRPQLRESTVVISRFSTLIYEALLMGREVVYYNPMDEPYPLFRESDAVLHPAENAAELVEALEHAINTAGVPTPARTKFLIDHCGNPVTSSTQNCANQILNLLKEQAGAGSKILSREPEPAGSNHSHAVLCETLERLEDQERSGLWLEEQVANWKARSDEAVGQSAWLEEQRANWQARAGELDRANAWLEEQRTNWQKRTEELESGNAWLEEQRVNWQQRSEHFESYARELEAQLKQHQEQRAVIEQELAASKSLLEGMKGIGAKSLGAWLRWANQRKG